MLTEWQTIRDLMKAFDDRIHDLRKYGISFITTLLTAQSLLLPSSLVSNAINSNITDYVKLGILSITLVLVIALRQIERVYQLYQTAANLRGIIVERRLNIELGETMTDRSARFRMSDKITRIYVLFALADAGIGLFVLDSPFYKLLLSALAGGVSLWLWRIGKSQLTYKREAAEDWSFDRTECKQEQTVKITLTNLSQRKPQSAFLKLFHKRPRNQSIEFAGGDLVCGIRLALTESDVSGPSAIEWIRTGESVSIPPLDYYSWFLPIMGKEPGIYEVYPTVDKETVEKAAKKWDAKMLSSMEQLEKSANPLPEWPKVQSPLYRRVWPVALTRKLTITAIQPDSRLMESSRSKKSRNATSKSPR